MSIGNPHYRRLPGSLGVLAAIAVASTLAIADGPPATGPSALGPSTVPSALERLGPELPPPPADLSLIRSTFANLSSADATVRAQSLTWLLSLRSADLPSLQKVVEAARPLAPAQAMVLRQIVTQVYLSGQGYESIPATGFLGVRMEQIHVGYNAVPQGAAAPGFAVIITERMAGFAGARMLRDGDIILGIVERPGLTITDTMNFSQAVREMGAGAVIHFQLLRDGQVKTVGVKLDPRPQAADPFGVTQMEDLLARRKSSADEYWRSHFAALAKENVS